jgi:hypothetical protein
MSAIAEKIYLIEQLSASPADTTHLLDKVIHFLTEKDRKKLADFHAKLLTFELRYGMSTQDFQQRFAAGELGDEGQWFDWEGYAALASSLETKLATAEAGRG